MNDNLPALLLEIEESRTALREQKEILKEEANPVRRFHRSWHRHRARWIAGGAAVVGLVALAFLRRGKARPYVPPGYVVIKPEKKAGLWSSAAQILLGVARPALTLWLKSKAQGRREP